MKIFLSMLSALLFWGTATNLQAQAWASHHNMTSASYQAKFNDYKDKGYRLTQVDGYRVGNKTRYAAIWQKKTGPAYKARHGMSSATYQAKFDEFKKQGYRLVLVDGCGAGNGATYSAIWQKKSGPAYKTHHGMTKASYQTKFNTYTAQGYRLTWVSGYGVGNQNRYAAIWEKKSGPAYKTHHEMTSATYQSKFNQYNREGYVLTLVSGHNIGNTDYYTAIWEKKNTTYSARHRMSSLGYQNEFDNHKYSGYKLKQVSGYAKSGKSQFAAIWTSTNAWKNKDRRHIDKTIKAFMSKHQVPGASVALMKNGKLIYAKGYGVMDKSTKDAVGPSSLFRVASVSKPITGVAIMKLSESNNGLLNQKVLGAGSILGTTYGSNNYSNWEKQIKVQHLLEHTAGGNQWNNKNDGGAGDPMFQQTSYNHSQLIGWVLDNRNPEKQPGTKYDYSNFGYSLLGRVIEKKTGTSYENYVRNKILKPCGIKNMYIAGDKKSNKRYNEVTYYGSNAYNMKVKRMDAHGGWLGSAIDLSRFLTKTDGKNTHPDIIKKASYNTMITPSTASNKYAKGWSINGSNEWHAGKISGTGAIIVQAGNGWSWVFLMNSTWEGEADQMMWDVVNGIGTVPGHDWF